MPVRKNPTQIRREANIKGRKLKMPQSEINRVIKEVIGRTKPRLRIADIEGKKGDHTATITKK